MVNKYIYILLFIGISHLQAQVSTDGKVKLTEAEKMEELLYPTFSQEILTKAMTLYHEAGDHFYQKIYQKPEYSLQNSYYTLYAWLQESELLEALNRSRPICDIYVNTFDKLIPADQFKEYKQNEITKLQYDTTYIKTLWVLFYNTQECHKDLYTAKYGDLLKKYITKEQSTTPEVYIAVIQANTNIGLFTEAYTAFKDYQSGCKGIKLTTEQRTALIKSLTDLKANGVEALSEEQLKEIQNFLK